MKVVGADETSAPVNNKREEVRNVDVGTPLLLAIAIAIPIGLFILVVYVIAKSPSELDIITMFHRLINELRDLFGK